MAQIAMAYNNLQQTLPPLLSRSSVGATVIMDPGCSSSGCSSSGEPSKAQAVSFTVGFSEPAKNPKKMPKRIAATRTKRRQEVSEATIEEKQKLAEKRRKKHIEDRLEKIHQMEEEAQRLAQAMVPLIEASQNGLPARKLHTDNDVVGNVEETIRKSLESSSNNSINGGGRGSENGDAESSPNPPK